MNGGIGGSGYYGMLDSVAIGGNLTNAGTMTMDSSFSVGGNLQNSGFLRLTGVVPNTEGPALFSVGGRLVNTGILQWGDNVDPVHSRRLEGLSAQEPFL